ncbi:unnamed protein product [Peniophora sp. CBMAI 1063]|nr:unnamed protein product [Peniophora sp. CBMAI 1063]
MGDLERQVERLTREIEGLRSHLKHEERANEELRERLGLEERQHQATRADMLAEMEISRKRQVELDELRRSSSEERKGLEERVEAIVRQKDQDIAERDATLKRLRSDLDASKQRVPSNSHASQPSALDKGNKRAANESVVGRPGSQIAPPSKKRRTQYDSGIGAHTERLGDTVRIANTVHERAQSGMDPTSDQEGLSTNRELVRLVCIEREASAVQLEVARSDAARGAMDQTRQTITYLTNMLERELSLRRRAEEHIAFLQRNEAMIRKELDEHRASESAQEDHIRALETELNKRVVSSRPNSNAEHSTSACMKRSTRTLATQTEEEEPVDPPEPEEPPILAKALKQASENGRCVGIICLLLKAYMTRAADPALKEQQYKAEYISKLESTLKKVQKSVLENEINGEGSLHTLKLRTQRLVYDLQTKSSLLGFIVGGMMPTWLQLLKTEDTRGPPITCRCDELNCEYSPLNGRILL